MNNEVRIDKGDSSRPGDPADIPCPKRHLQGVWGPGLDRHLMAAFLMFG